VNRTPSTLQYYSLLYLPECNLWNIIGVTVRATYTSKYKLIKHAKRDENENSFTIKETYFNIWLNNLFKTMKLGQSAY
jgi:hypothetical protein